MTMGHSIHFKCNLGCSMYYQPASQGGESGHKTNVDSTPKNIPFFFPSLTLMFIRLWGSFKYIHVPYECVIMTVVSCVRGSVHTHSGTCTRPHRQGFVYMVKSISFNRFYYYLFNKRAVSSPPTKGVIIRSDTNVSVMHVTHACVSDPNPCRINADTSSISTQTGISVNSP